jgi:hypothetical protein
MIRQLGGERLQASRNDGGGSTPAVDSSIRWLDRARAIYCIGDSNVIAYDRLACRSLGTGTLYTCRSIHLRRFFSSDDVDQMFEEFHPRMWSALARNSLVDGPQGPKSVLDPIVLIVFALRYWASPVLALRDNDFVMPDPTAPILASVDRSRELIPYAVVVELIRSVLTPYVLELAQLRQAFGDVYVLAMHPPHPDDDAFLRVFPALQHRTTAAIRYKVLHVFNAVLRSLAADVGVECVNAFDRLTIDGLLDPKFNLDDAHLNRAAARITIETLVSHVEATAASAVVGTGQ